MMQTEEVEELGLGRFAVAGRRAGGRRVHCGELVRRQPDRRTGPGRLGKVTGTGGGAGTTAFAGDDVVAAAAQSIVNGRKTFRFDTFGDEAFWGDTLKLHQAIAGSANGGVGPGVSPKTALSVGLKVDAEAVPADVAAGIKAGTVDLDDPKTTLALLKLNAVVGVTGFFSSTSGLQSIGIQCALCHSTVDDSFAPGIGKRLDGWPNRDLNVGAIISLAPDLSAFTNLLQVDEATVKTVLAAWGPGRFDAELGLDGKGFRPDGKTAAVLLPAAFGLAGVGLHTYTGWGSVTHWNALVANLEMHGKGTFFDPRLNNAAKFPVAARAGFAHVVNDPDLDHEQAGRSAHLPARAQGAAAAGGQLRRGRRRARQGGLQQEGGLRRVPRAADVQRAGLADAHGRGDRHRRLPGQALARRALPHDAARRPAHAGEGRLLSRRPLRDAGRRRRPLRLVHEARSVGRGEGRPGRVPEVALIRARLTRVPVVSP